MTTGLDDRLAAARPADRAADSGLDDALTALIATSEQEAFRGRDAGSRPWRLGGLRLRSKVVIGAVAAVLVLGTATTAVATSEKWSLEVAHPDASTRLKLPSGNTCDIRVVAELNVGVSYGLPELTAAQKYLKTIDVSVFDLPKLRKKYLADGRIDRTGSLDAQTYDAALQKISDLTWAHLAGLGFNPHDLGISSEGNCAATL